jgi:hypothetical protein
MVKYEGRHWPASSVVEDACRWDGDTGLLQHGCNAGDHEVWDPPTSCGRADAPGTPFGQLLNTIFNRINVASGPYQMVGVLGDGIVFTCPTAEESGNSGVKLEAEYLEEVPHEYFTRRYRGRPRLWWSFGFGLQRRSLEESREGGTLFQVHLWFYPGDCSKTGVDPPTLAGASAEVSNKQVLRLMEALHTSWNTYSNRMSVGRWLHTQLMALRPGKVLPVDSIASPPDMRTVSTRDTVGGGGTIRLAWDLERAPRDLAQWASGGHVDVVVQNTRAEAVVVWRSRAATPEMFDQVAVVEPNTNARWESHEREMWQVDTFGGELIRSWAVDCALGVVQRFEV